MFTQSRAVGAAEVRICASSCWAGARMAFAVSDELLGTFVPIAVYWLYSGLYIVLDGLGMDDYRLHPKGEETRNIVSKWTVVRGVLVQQAFQIAVSLLLFTVIPPCNILLP
jgi:sphinganine C4-monooxygenase